MIRAFMLLGLACIVGSMAMAQEAIPTPPPAQRSIIVTGSAQRMVPPDLGLVVLAVETQADTVARAVEQNNSSASKVMDAMRALRIRDLAVRTLGFDVQPIYEQPPVNRPVTQPLRIIAYRVTNRVEARIPEMGTNTLSANVGKVLDAGLNAGANRIDNVSFTLENDQPVQREAFAAATKDAAATAAALATAAGVQLGPLMTLSTTPYYRQPPMPVFAARSADMMASSVPIVAGPLTIQVTVTAVYGIR
jgi:hypothetical protein